MVKNFFHLLPIVPVVICCWEIVVVIYKHTKVCIIVFMNTTMTFKIDKDLKAQAQKTAQQMGVPLSTLINAYLREIAATGRVELSIVEEMTPQMIRIIESFKHEIATNQTVGPFNNVGEAVAYLDKH